MKTRQREQYDFLFKPFKNSFPSGRFSDDTLVSISHVPNPTRNFSAESRANEKCVNTHRPTAHARASSGQPLPPISGPTKDRNRYYFNWHLGQRLPIASWTAPRYYNGKYATISLVRTAGGECNALIIERNDIKYKPEAPGRRNKILVPGNPSPRTWAQNI